MSTRSALVTGVLLINCLALASCWARETELCYSHQDCFECERCVNGTCQLQLDMLNSCGLCGDETLCDDVPERDAGVADTSTDDDAYTPAIDAGEEPDAGGPICDDGLCLAQLELCGISGSGVEGECADPDVATNTCDAPGTRDPSGPFLYIEDPELDIEVVPEHDDPDNCSTNGNTVMMVTFVVNDSEGDFDGDYVDTYWSESGSVFESTTYFTSYAGGYLTVYNCFNSSGSKVRAFYIGDNAGNGSNRHCVTFDVP